MELVSVGFVRVGFLLKSVHDVILVYSELVGSKKFGFGLNYPSWEFVWFGLMKWVLWLCFFELGEFGWVRNSITR